MKTLFVVSGFVLSHLSFAKIYQTSYYYGLGQSTLSANDQANVKVILDSIDIQNTYYLLEGFADNIGSVSANTIVANKRANHLKELLISHGVPQELIRVKPFDTKGTDKERKVLFKFETDPTGPNIASSFDATSIYERFGQKEQSFLVYPENNIIIRGKEGIEVRIPRNSLVDSTGKPVVGPVRIYLTEYADLKDLVLSGGNTAAGDLPLTTGGSINIRAEKKGQPLTYSSNTNFEVRFPTTYNALTLDSLNFESFGGVNSLFGTTWLIDSTQFTKQVISRRIWGQMLEWRHEQDSIQEAQIIQLEQENGEIVGLDSICQKTKAYDYKVELKYSVEQYTNAPGNLEYGSEPEFEKKSPTFYYVAIPAFQLGFINCDRFMNRPSIHNKIVKTESTKNAARCLVLIDDQGVMPAYASSSNICFPNIPEGQSVYIAMYKEGDTYFVDLQHVEPNQKEIIEGTFQALSEQEFIALFDSI